MPTTLPNSTDRRFLGTALMVFLLIFAIVWLWIVSAPMAYLDREYPMWQAKMRLIQNGPDHRVIVLGDSAAVAGLIPARLGPNVVNLAFGGGTTIDAYYASQKLAANRTVPQAVIISLSPTHFMVDDTFWGRSVEFGFLDHDEVDEIRENARALKDKNIFGPVSPGDVDARLKNLLYLVRFPSYYFPPLVHGLVFTRYHANNQMLQSVLSTRGQGYFGTAHGATNADFDTEIKAFVPTPLLDRYFDRTLAYYQKQNVPVYFLSMPHNEASARLYYPGLEATFTDYLQDYASRYPNFHLLGPALPIYPATSYGDAYHLNEPGATEWSDSVAKMLTDANVPGGPFGPN